MTKSSLSYSILRRSSRHDSVESYPIYLLAWLFQIKILFPNKVSEEDNE